MWPRYGIWLHLGCDIEFPQVELVGGSLTYEFLKRAGRDYTCRI